MAVISYIAYLVDNPAEQVSFYNRHLKTEEIGRSPKGDISVTDGFFNLTFFKKRAELHEVRMEPGLNHIGFEVDSLEEVKNRYLKYMPRGTVVAESGDLQHGQIRIHDPDCNPVTLSEKDLGSKRSGDCPVFVMWSITRLITNGPAWRTDPTQSGALRIRLEIMSIFQRERVGRSTSEYGIARPNSYRG